MEEGLIWQNEQNTSMSKFTVNERSQMQSIVTTFENKENTRSRKNRDILRLFIIVSSTWATAVISLLNLLAYIAYDISRIFLFHSSNFEIVDCSFNEYIIIIV